MIQTVFSFGLFFYFYGECVLADKSPPPLEWLPFPPPVAAVLITPKDAESPGSSRIGVIRALVFFSPHLRPFRINFTLLAGPVAH